MSTPEPTLRASVHTLGCRLNQYESALIEDRLREAGYAIVPFGEPADIGIINSCTVTREADAKTRQAVRAFIRQNPHARAAVVGCSSELRAEALAAIPGVSIVWGTHAKEQVVDRLTSLVENAHTTEAPIVVRPAGPEGPFVVAQASQASVQRRANLKIQDGCDARCGYCAVPLARGPARSRVFEDVLREARLLVARGAREIVLTGVNLGRYRHDGHTLVDIIDALSAIDELRRIRISSIEPTTISEGILERMAMPGHPLAPHLHIPIQSGSANVLKQMNRPYAPGEIRDLLRGASARVPLLCLGADFIVGAPGEDDDAFEETRAFLDATPIAYAHVFAYSPRPGTPMALLPAPDARIVSTRSAELRHLAIEKRHAFLAANLGGTADVLFEHEERPRPGKSLASGEASHEMAKLWAGYTGNYVRVAARSDSDLTNTMRAVFLRRIRGAHVEGELDEG